jgi:hypothetical protein
VGGIKSARAGSTREGPGLVRDFMSRFSEARSVARRASSGTLDGCKARAMQSRLAMKRYSRIWLCMALFATGACDSQSDALDTARARWRQQAVDDYSFEYRTTGFAPPVDARIVVANGAVTDVENLGAGFELALETAPTIETLFDEVEDNLDDGVRVTVMWDPAFGFPVTASAQAGEEGWGFEVSAFQRAP